MASIIGFGDYEGRVAILGDEVIKGVPAAKFIGRHAGEVLEEHFAAPEWIEWEMRANRQMCEERKAAPILEVTSNGNHFVLGSSWLGLPNVAFARHIWQFPVEVGGLDDQERETLCVYGATCDPKITAKALGLDPVQVDWRLNQIANRVGIEVNQIPMLATEYAEASSH